jgi:16S rRNA (cytidine1402-2'-O)-methyltransferase
MGKLYIVPGPIGNLEDMTLRAIRVLKEADLILAEDTRTTAKLLQHFGIDTRMLSHHQHNEHKVVKPLVEKMLGGQSLAVMSEAGTPGISDPGFLLVRECLRTGVEVECLPGATAFVPALVCSGLPCDRFIFEGFLPVKKGRRARLEGLAAETRTMVLYESPYRLVKTLGELAEVLGPERPASVSREISKMHEEHVRGTLLELESEFGKRSSIKGEITLVVGGAAKNLS